jgi:hypothetical protein
MATIVTRAGKGSPLTNTEVDANFTNINTELGTKANSTALSSYLPLTGGIVGGQLEAGDLLVKYNSATSWTTRLATPWDQPAEVLNMNESGFSALTFHVVNKYANLFGYDENNVLKSNNNTIWHSGNFTPSNYLLLTGGTVSGILNTTASGIFTAHVGYNPATNVERYTLGGRDALQYGLSIDEFGGNGNGLRANLAGYYGVSIGTQGATRLSVDQSGVTTAFVEMRAPIFRDSDNTAYYLDPTGNSVVGNIFARGQIRATGWWGSQSASGTGLGLELGQTSGRGYIISYNRDTSAYGAMSFDATDFAFNVVASGYAQINTSFRAPIFYDSDNTAYYLDPLSTSVLNNIRAATIEFTNGFTAINLTNSTYNMLNDPTGRVAIYLGGGADTNSYYDNTTHNFRNRDAGLYAYISSSGIWAAAFTDFNNTAYYLDPAGTSNLGQINFGATNKFIRGGASGETILGVGGVDSAFLQVSSNYYKIWNAGNFDPSTKQNSLGYTPVNRAGDTMTGTLTMSSSPITLAFNGSLPYIDFQQSNVASGRNYRIRSGIEGVANGGFCIRDLTAGTNVLSIDENGTLTASGGRVFRSSWISRFMSSSDFVDGTLVTTDIPATAQDGDSFIIEITGKSYSDGNPPFKVIAQGYLYNNGIIGKSAISYGGDFVASMKMFEDGGVLKFWWPRYSYWNAFEVRVVAMNGPSNDSLNRNRVTAITNSTEPDGTKKVTVTVVRSLREDTWINGNKYFGSDGTIYGNIFRDSGNGEFYLDPNGSTSLNVAGNLQSSGNLILNNGGNRIVRIGSSTNYHYDLQSVGDDFQIREAGTTPRLTISYPSGNVTASAEVRATIFRDSNNASFYVDPQGGSVLGGQVSFAGGSYIATNGDVYARRDNETTGVYYFADGGSKYLYWDGSSYIFGSSGAVNTAVGVYAPAFYDNNDSAYRADPTGTSIFNNLTLGGRNMRAFESNSYIEFTVNGDANTYYPVLIQPSAVWYHFGNWSISRGYADNAPWDPTGSGAHKGGLTFTWQWSGDTGWGGNDKSYRVIQFAEQYTTMVGGMSLSVNGMIVWLRGGGEGGASYRLHGPAGMTNSVVITLGTYTAANGSTFAPRSYNATTVSNEIMARFPIRNNGQGGELWDGNTRVLSDDRWINNKYFSSNGDIYGSVFRHNSTSAYYLNLNGESSLYSLTLSGGTYFQPNSWIQFNNSYGLYWPNNNGAHIEANTVASYGQITLRGSRNSYGGIYDTYSGVNGIMYDNGGNGGIYREVNGRWYQYHSVGNNCTAFGTSTTYSGYNIYVPTGLKSDGRIDATIFYDAAEAAYYLDPNATGTSLNVAGSIVAGGNVTAYSDARVKENIETVDSALHKLAAIRGVTYTRNDLEDKERRYAGVIAQEIEQVLPEAVFDRGDLKSVDYNGTIALLIQAVKELKSELDHLKAQTCH